MSEIEKQSEEALISFLAQNLAVIKMETLDDPANSEFLDVEDLTLQDSQVLEAMIDLGIGPSSFDREANKSSLQIAYQDRLRAIVKKVQKGTYIQGYSQGYKDAESVVDQVIGVSEDQIRQMVFDMLKPMEEDGEYTYQIYASGYATGFLDLRNIVSLESK